MLWNDREAIIAELERVIPALKEGGGCFFSSDHSIPIPSASITSKPYPTVYTGSENTDIKNGGQIWTER